MLSISDRNVANITVENEWNDSDEQGVSMHSIHAYPAKFPAFIASKAFEYARTEGVNVESVADIFCGCGTVALEAKLHGVKFWGCDINPVATLIAKTKSESYNCNVLMMLFTQIKDAFDRGTGDDFDYAKAIDRLKYWHTEKSYVDLCKLKKAIVELHYDENKYRDAFLCLFSSILKATSRWLTKSIKPQVDPNKKEIDVWQAFEKQTLRFVNAVSQINEYDLDQERDISIVTANYLEVDDLPKVDMIISSPPYVTSYEYADLHQLSSLWLDVVTDYRDLRKGSIGSAYNSQGYDFDLEELNEVGQRIIKQLYNQNNAKKSAKIKSVARYYCDIQHAVEKSAQMMNDDGMVFFVVGDTEYKGVPIKNSEHLIASLVTTGFTDIKATKRIISNKLCIPYRDERGKFSSDKSKRTIYHEEYIISARYKGIRN